MENLNFVLNSFDENLDAIKERKDILIGVLKGNPDPIVEDLVYKELSELCNKLQTYFLETGFEAPPLTGGPIEPPQPYWTLPDLRPLSIGIIRNHQNKTFQITANIINHGSTLQAPFKIFVAVEIRYLDSGTNNTLYIDNTHLVDGTVKIPGYGAGVYSTVLKGEYPMHYIEDHSGNKFDLVVLVDDNKYVLGGNIIELNERNNNFVLENHFHTKKSPSTNY